MGVECPYWQNGIAREVDIIGNSSAPYLPAKPKFVSLPLFFISSSDHRRATAQPGSAAECFLTFLKRERARLWLFWQGGGGIIGDERRRVKGAAAGFSSLESGGGGGGGK